MIYLDHNATSPLLAEVHEAMAPWLGVPANLSSVHRAGQAAAAAVERAREQVSALFGGNPAGVVFTSGATEANHTFLRGLRGPGALLVSAIEHPCVRGAAEASRREVRTLPVGADGRARLPASLEGVRAVSLMAANHETGVIQPVAEARALCDREGVALHVDASQAAGRIPLALGGVAGVVLSSHKLGGPGGVGALVLPDGEPFPPLLTGGAQERGRRAGTVYAAGVVGFGAACAVALRDLDARRALWSGLSGVLRRGLVALGARVVGEGLLPNTTCVVFDGLRGESLVQALDLRGICVSSGAACASGSAQPSPVLAAMGDPEPAGALRVSLGPDNTAADVDALLQALPEVLAACRAAADFSS